MPAPTIRTKGFSVLVRGSFGSAVEMEASAFGGGESERESSVSFWISGADIYLNVKGKECLVMDGMESKMKNKNENRD